MATSSGNSLNDYMRSLGIPSNKAGHRQDFAAISLKNTEIVDELIALSRKLTSKKQFADADKLLDIAEEILNNNKMLRTKVGEVLSDVD